MSWFFGEIASWKLRTELLPYHNPFWEQFLKAKQHQSRKAQTLVEATS